MPFLEMEFRVAGQPLTTVGFGQTQALVADFRPAFRAMYEEYAKYEEAVFASEGSQGLGEWAPLSPAYAKWKAKHFPGRPILTRTGTLRAAARTLVLLTQNRLVMGPSGFVPYAVFHERGTGRMPERPFVRPNPALLRRLREIARSHLVALRRAAKQAAAGVPQPPVGV